MQLLDDFITDYLNDEKASYALLITGPWGCGKTFYWKNHITPMIEKQNEKAKVLYITLYGVSSTSDIDRQIFFNYFVAY